MRIIAGQYRSRALQAPAGLGTRPTSDKLRETLFNVLAPRFQSAPQGVRFLDLYAGSGAVGIEALSRGAARVDFVERAPVALAVLRGNLAGLGLTEGFKIHASSVAAALRRMIDNAGAVSGIAFDMIFLDPPYDAEREYVTALGLLGTHAASLLAPQSIVIAEHRRKDPIGAQHGILVRTRLLEQGDAALSFFAERPSLSCAGKDGIGREGIGTDGID